MALFNSTPFDPNQWMSYADYDNMFPKPQETFSDGSMYADTSGIDQWNQNKANYYNNLAFKNNPFKVGDAGTTTLYGAFGNAPSTSWGDWKNPYRVSTNPFEGGQAFAVADPTSAGFNMPTEGWDRFWEQVFGDTGVQEEYVPTWFSGAQGKDTSNYDYLSRANPFQQNWGLDKASLMQKPDHGGFLGVLKDAAPALAILAAPFGMGALQSLFPALAGGTASLGAIDSALLSGAGAAGGAAASAAPAVGNAAMAAAGGQGAGYVAPAGVADAAASIAPAAIGDAGMSLAPSAFGPAMDASLASTLGAGASTVAGSAPIGASLAAAAGSGGGGLMDVITEAVKRMGSTAMDKFQKDPVGTLGTLVTAILDNQRARSNEKANSAQQERYEAGADPFGAERDYYQGLLKQSYDNPYALKDSPEYGGLGRIYQDQIARRDAAKGRTVAGELPRDIEMQDHFMKWLNDYRSGLQQAAGSNINPNGVYSSFLDNQRANQAASSNAYGGIPYALGKIFDPYANEKQSFTEDVMRFLKELV